jgi:hypothetical protein
VDLYFDDYEGDGPFDKHSVEHYADAVLEAVAVLQKEILEPAEREPDL